MYCRILTYTLAREHKEEWRKNRQEAQAHFSEQYRKSGYVDTLTFTRSRGASIEAIRVDRYKDRKSWGDIWEKARGDPRAQELHERWLSFCDEYTEEEFDQP